jgi:hypothetical protein
MPAMSNRILFAAAASLLATITAARADVITSTNFQGSYKAIDANPGPFAPTINDDGGSFLPAAFSGTLTQGTPQTTTFLQVAPIAGGSSVGTIAGSIDIAMILTGPGGAAVTGLTSSAGGNAAFLSNGTINFVANYDLFYGNQTDCLTWNASSCTPNGKTTTVGETLTATFADNAVLDIYLYNWSDWNMAPSIGFDLISGPTATVPEPASFAVFGVALIGLMGTMRFGRGGKGAHAQPALA